MLLVDNKSIGQKIRQEREKLGLTRQQLAELVSLSDYYIGQLERGERQMSLPVLVNIANVLHLSLDHLIYTPFDYKVQEAAAVYKEDNNHRTIELNSLFNRCSATEQELILKLVKTLIPYLERK